jgi:hypothetical protein
MEVGDAVFCEGGIYECSQDQSSALVKVCRSQLVHIQGRVLKVLHTSRDAEVPVMINPSHLHLIRPKILNTKTIQEEKD